MTHFRISDLSTPDGLGRQTFIADWEEPNGDYRPQISRDGQPVGYRRGQVFRTVLADFIARTEARGNTVEVLP